MRKIVILVALFACRSAHATSYWFDSTPFTTYGEFNPLPLVTTTQSGHTVKGLGPSQSIRFASSTAAIGIYSYFGTSTGYRTYVVLQGALGTIPNTQVGRVTIPGTGGGAWSVYTLATGLDTGTTYEYEIVCVLPIQGTITWYDGYLELDNLASVAHATRPIWGIYGDSITGVTNSHQTTIGSFLINEDAGSFSGTQYADMWQFAHASGKALFISGTAGASVVDYGQYNTSNIPAGVDALLIKLGVNDQVNLGTGGGQTTFQTAYTTMMTAFIARIGAGKPMVCLEPLSSYIDNRALCGTLIQAAISGMTDAYYFGTDNWIAVDASVMPDLLHPNAAGYALVGARETPIWSGASLEIVSPAHGTSGTPSAAFTVTLANAGSFSGAQAIVLTGVGGNITATAAGGSISNNGTANVTVTPVSAATNFTFTYNATGGGTSTIRPSTTQSFWTMPNAALFNANVVRPGNPTTSAVGAGF